MLILTRRVGETLVIGDDVRVVVIEVKGSQVKLGINAPKSTPVHREEVYERILSARKVDSGQGRPGAHSDRREAPLVLSTPHT